MRYARKAMAEVFRCAKGELYLARENGSRRPYICWAIAAAGGWRSWEYDTAKGIYKACMKVVQDRLDGEDTLESWLYYVHDIECVRPASHYSLVEPERLDKLFVTRQAWLDSLVEEFSKP
jgi:hypothetical protein